MALVLAMASLVFVRSRLRKSRSGPDPQGGFACTQAVSEMLSLAGGSFDCILLSEVIEHLESPHLATAKPRACSVPAAGCS
jgi:hypothetical protein